MLNIVDPEKDNRIPPLFRLAFRPFFLGGALFSLVALALWGSFWLTGMHWAPYGGWLWWHAHEMLFGFVSAIIAGFLLTAVQNWTAQNSINGWPLCGLCIEVFRHPSLPIKIVKQSGSKIAIQAV